MKFIYGAASLANNYHKKKKYNLPKKEKIKILKNLNKLGIKKIDTSPDYGDVEKLIGLYCNKSILVDSKLPRLNKRLSTIKLSEWIDRKIDKTLKNINEKKLNTYYFHDPRDLLSTNGELAYDKVNKLKSQNIIKKIGISVYDPKILDSILSNYDIDTIQSPFNIFDNRIIKPKYEKKIKNKKIELIVRSVFLQGILINKEFRFKIKDIKSLNILDKWYEYLKENKLNALNQCISFIKMNDIKNIVVGTNKFNDLLKIVNYEYENNKDLMKFKTSYKNLIEPFRW